MVKHIIFCKLKDNSEESCEKLVSVFHSMRGKVPQARTVEAHADFLHEGRSFDVVLEVTLDSKEALEEYQKDSYHCEVVKKYVHSVRTDSASVDYYY